ncbi:MAG TPA: ADYC domain-containing protein [Vineibacter sp.]|nr:ADYC domain-containing protein [Vineibacter sp.]
MSVRACSLAIAALLLSIGPAAAQTPASLKSIEAEGTQFKVTMSDGRVLRSPQLAGATLVIAMGGSTVRVRIDAVERDPEDTRTDLPASDAIWLHTFSVLGADGSSQNFCAPGPDGRRQGFPLSGRSSQQGEFKPAEPGVFELVCTSGAQGKCVRFGYRPWSRTADGTGLHEAYNACTRMVRGDYGGIGQPFTKDGMRIDVYDPWGIQRAENDAADTFEAGWSPEGAVCVHHVRVKENTTLEALEAEFPRLKGRTGAVCTEAFARSHGAIVFNRSRP